MKNDTKPWLRLRPKTQIRNVMKADFARFCLVGLAGFVINFILLTFLYKTLHVHLFISQLIAAEVALFNNFMWHHHWTYKDRGGHKTIGSLIIQFHATSWVAIIGSALLMSLGVNVWHISYSAALVFSSAVALFWNFGWTKFVIWRGQTNVETPVKTSSSRNYNILRTWWRNRLKLFVSKIGSIRSSTRWTSKFLVLFITPALIYLLIFFLLQPHYLMGFSTGFYLDNGDGFQNVWNIWWVDKALTADNTTPYFTTMLHWPHGTTLIPQTMNIFNGLMSIPLMHLFNFSLVQAVNFTVLFSFVMGGVTMFWFIQKLHKTYWVSLIGGALFTFSSYHFAHALGHLQLVSLEWIPLFLLAFWTLLERFRIRDAFFAAGALFLVLLCDYYYLFWSVMVGGLWLLWRLIHKEIPFNKRNLAIFGLYVALVLVLVGPLVYSLIHLTRVDGLLGAHDAGIFSLDPLQIIIPGGSWHWGSLTQFYWIHLPYIAESSVFFGVGVLVVLSIAGFKRLFKRKEYKAPAWLDFWWIVLMLFSVLSFGPRLHLAGHVLDSVPLPYALLEKLIPTLKISGMPVRWILIALMAAIVIVTYTLSRLDITKEKGKQIAILFIVVTAIDLYPFNLPLTPSTTAAYVEQLKQLPPGAVLDEAAPSEPQQLRNQTIHSKPMVFGYVTRLPNSVGKNDFPIFAAIQEHRYADLCSQFKLRYITEPVNRSVMGLGDKTIIYKDSIAKIYDLSLLPEFSSSSPACRL